MWGRRQIGEGEGKEILVMRRQVGAVQIKRALRGRYGRNLRVMEGVKRNGGESR